MKVNDELEKWLNAIPQEKELLLTRKRGYSLAIQNCFAASELVPLRALGAQFWQQTEVITELRMHELIVLYRLGNGQERAMSVETQPSEKTYSVGGIARIARVSTQSIRNWEDKLPPLIKTPGGHRRYTDAHVQAIRKLMGQSTEPANNAQPQQ